MLRSLFPSLRGYERAWLRGDLIAGLTVWAVLVPESLAYASIAGVSPVVGLYAAPLALLAYAAFGSSRHLIVGPASATAALSAATVADVAGGDAAQFAALTAVLALCAGVAALVAGLGRLGFLAGFISEPVLKGFIVGLSLTIIVGQIPKLLGIEGGDGNFFEKAWALLGEVSATDVTTLVVGAGSLALILGLRRVAPLVPASLIAVAAGVLAVVVLNLDQHGVDIVGTIDAGLPSFGLPDAESADYGALAAGGVAIMLVGFGEGLGAAKTYAAKERYEVDSNRELLGLGAANAAAGLSSGMVVSGSLSKTAVNGSAGARTQASGLVVAALTLVTLLLLTGLFERLPEATLAAVVITAVVDLVDVSALRRLYRFAAGAGRITARPDFTAAVAALIGVLVFDTLPGLFIGIGVSLVLLLYRASRPHIAELGRVRGAGAQWADLARHPENAPVPGVAVLRVDGGLFFANADAVRARVRRVAAREDVHAVVLDAETIAFVDLTATTALVQLSDELQREGVQLVVARELGEVRELVRRAGPERLPRLYPTVEEAVEAVGSAPATLRRG